MTLIEVTDRRGTVCEPDWLDRAEIVHRQLRPQLPPNYRSKMERVFAGGGRMVVATDSEQVVGLAVWRAYENTFIGRYLYVDDVVVDQRRRSQGIGRALLAHCETVAKALGSLEIVLDSGVQRGEAHRFYFREGYVINAFNFSKPLT
ncbi:MAG: GNAT family N-acetyltransferase [Myxococcales bacterium FL481]|nr:MAG: GNAT family N-acetyltransferase [Myxococcales bacterium FL481]